MALEQIKPNELNRQSVDATCVILQELRSLFVDQID